MLAISTAVMFVLLVVRQIVELQENDRLFAQQLAQEARFQSLVQRSSDIILVVHSGRTIVYASPAAARVFGDNSPVRAGSRLIDVVREDDRPVVGPLVTTGRGARRVVFHLPAPQGEWREIEALWTDLRDDPAVGGVVINCRDITAGAELEAAAAPRAEARRGRSPGRRPGARCQQLAHGRSRRRRPARRRDSEGARRRSTTWATSARRSIVPAP